MAKRKETVIDAEFTEITPPKVNVEGFGQKEADGLFSVTKDLLGSFFSKPAEQGIGEWLGDRLKEHLPQFAGEIIDEMRDGITSGIDTFNAGMNELDAACEQGKTKEEWMRDKLREVPAGMDAQAYGEYLADMNEALTEGNEALNAAIDSETGGTIKLNDMETATEREPVEWSKTALFDTAQSIANQAAVTAAGMPVLSSGVPMALAAAQGEAGFDRDDIADMETGDENDTGLKTVAAGALGICVKLEKIPLLSKLTPISAITDIACWGVESVKSVANFARGKLSATQAVDHIGRATSVAVSHMCSNGIGKKLCAMIPVIGPTVGMAIGTAVDSLASKSIGQMIHAGIDKIKPLATEVLETAKSVVKAGVNMVKNAVNKVLAFVGID